MVGKKVIFLKYYYPPNNTLFAPSLMHVVGKLTHNDSPRGHILWYAMDKYEKK
jgi:hypothetical protein